MDQRVSPRVTTWVAGSWPPAPSPGAGAGAACDVSGARCDVSGRACVVSCATSSGAGPASSPATRASRAPLLFQQITRCHSVFSCFSPLWPVHCRLVASDSVATREPLLVLRTSGSAPKFPISMTLFRLRLTKNLRTLGGPGPRATTVYDPQVILSIKDTPLVPLFCRHPDRGNGSAQHHHILHGTAVIARPPCHLAEPQRFIQPAGA